MVKLQNRAVLLLAVFSFTAMASTVLLKTSNDFIKTFGNLEKLNGRSYLEFSKETKSNSMQAEHKIDLK